jgi:hypothetical protein
VSKLLDAAQDLVDIVMQQCSGYTSGPGFEAAQRARELQEQLTLVQQCSPDPANYSAFDQLLLEMKNDPVGSQQLQQGRKWLAEQMAKSKNRPLKDQL